MRIRFEVAPDDLVRMGQKLGVNISNKDAEALLVRHEMLFLHSLEDCRASILRNLVNDVQQNREAKKRAIPPQIQEPGGER